MVIGLGSLFSPSVDGINSNLFGKAKSNISTNLSNNVSQCITSITALKNVNRASLSRIYKQGIANCERKHKKLELKQRYMRAFKVNLINEYCTSIIEDV